MSVQQMRAEIAKVYAGLSWKNKVSKMSDGQVVAVYHKFLIDRKLKRY